MHYYYRLAGFAVKDIFLKKSMCVKASNPVFLSLLSSKKQQLVLILIVLISLSVGITAESSSTNTNSYCSLESTSSIMTERERSFIMVKPDGVQRGLVGEVIKRFEQKGFKLVAMKLTWVSYLGL